MKQELAIWCHLPQITKALPDVVFSCMMPEGIVSLVLGGLSDAQD